MKKSVEIAAHLFFWIAFTAFTYMLCQIYLEANPTAVFGQHLFHVITLEVIMGLIFFYVTFFGIPLSRKSKARRILMGSLLVLLLLFFAYPATRFGLWQVMSSIIPHVIVIFLAVIFRRFSEAIHLEEERKEMLLEKVKSELSLLKMQVSPHFLLNTLNSIDYLVSHDPDRASSSLEKLGDILRYLLYETTEEKISISSELAHLEDFIELVRLRVKEKNWLTFDVDGRTANLQIAPMLFLPLVENACKFAPTREGEKSVAIQVFIRDNQLTFMVENKISENSPKMDSNAGIGLKLVRRRLELIYPGKHNLIVKEQNNRFKVELKIELDA